MLLISSGKNVITDVITTFPSTPNPNQITSSGASATFGSDWNPTMYGNAIRSIRRDDAIVKPTTMPTVEPSKESKQGFRECYAGMIEKSAAVEWAD